MCDLLRAEPRVVDAICGGLEALGATHAFGVIGGAILPFHDAMVRSGLRIRHFQHEGGAAYAAVEASLESGRPSVVFTTTGPGLTNAISGVVAARQEGGQVVVVSGHTGPAQRGRFPVQETSDQSYPGAGLFSPGPYFDAAWIVESAADTRIALRQIAALSQRQQGFVAHLALSLGSQALACAPVELTRLSCETMPDRASLEAAVAALARAPFAVWVGHGARGDAEAVRALIEHTGAPYLVTPRGKGIVSERAPGFLGVTGFGGHEGIAEELERLGVRRMLVLGSRLGEASCFYEAGLCPPEGLVHVDIDPRSIGTAYPDRPVLGLQGQIGPVVRALRAALPPGPRASTRFRGLTPAGGARDGERVRPEYLLDRLQARVVEGSDALVMAESGNAFCWANNRLAFDAPRRYRLAGMFCPMGYACAGAVGAALVGHRHVVALVGDGSLLMQNELNTAARYGARVVWVVLNDSCYGMVDKGMRGLGYPGAELAFPEVDFGVVARAMGCRGVSVSRESDLDAALEDALAFDGPSVVDVRIVASTPAPLGGRNKSLGSQTERT